MPRLFIGLEGDRGVHHGAEVDVSEDEALSRWGKLYDALYPGQPASKRGRSRKASAPEGEEPTTDVPAREE